MLITARKGSPPSPVVDTLHCTSLFPFSGILSDCVKHPTDTPPKPIYAPYLNLSRKAPSKKGYMAPRKILLHLIEKEYDDEGMEFCQIALDIRSYGASTFGGPNFAGDFSEFFIFYDDGSSTEIPMDVTSHEIYGEWIYNAIIQTEFLLPGDKTITQLALKQGDQEAADCSDAVKYYLTGLNIQVNGGDKLNISLEISKQQLDDAGICGNTTVNFYDDFLVEENAIKIAGIGLNYFGARYYDPEVGRWNRPDPKNEFWDSYSYVGSNPTVRIDSDGRWSVLIHLFSGGFWEVMTDSYRNEELTRRLFGTERGNKIMRYYSGRKEPYEFRVHYGENFKQEDREAHRRKSKEGLLNLLTADNPDPKRFPKRQWRGIQRHATRDYFHDVEPHASSPFESLVLNVFGEEALNIWQDIPFIKLLTPFSFVASLVSHAGIDYTIKMFIMYEWEYGIEIQYKSRIEPQINEEAKIKWLMELKKRETGKKHRYGGDGRCLDCDGSH